MPAGSLIESVNIWMNSGSQDGGNRSISVGPLYTTSTVLDLKQLIQDREGIAANTQNLTYLGKSLNDDKTMADYNVVNNAVIFFAYRFNGGATQKQCGITMSKEACCVTLEEGDWNVKMPCSHVISSDGMKGWVKSCVKKTRGQEVTCPLCRVEWDFDVCCQVGMLNENDRREIEIAMGENYNRGLQNTRSCPKCKLYCVNDSSNVKIMCPRQSCNEWFCFRCGRSWEAQQIYGGGEWCGNEGCPTEPAVDDQGRNGLQELLRTCALTTISGVSGCPERRACISCNASIHFQPGCHHMTCYSRRCGGRTKFCFICLTPGEHHLSECSKVPAPIQTI